MDRETRRLIHDKGSRIKSVTSVPLTSDGIDGDIYIFRGNLYIKDNNLWNKFRPVSDFITSKLTDSTGGTVSDIINDTTSSVKDDLATLAAKINKIIELLGLDVK